LSLPSHPHTSRIASATTINKPDNHYDNIHKNIMRFPSLNHNLSYTDEQPRDGGAPNPRFESSPMMLTSMPPDEEQPRDGG
jgi:hypothetical protein